MSKVSNKAFFAKTKMKQIKWRVAIGSYQIHDFFYFDGFLNNATFQFLTFQSI